jgi:hypothetical protein
MDIDMQIQRGLYVAIELVGMLRFLHADPRFLPQIRADLLLMAQWLEFLLDGREQIVTKTTETPDLAILGARVICPACRTRAKNQSRLRNGEQYSSAPDLVWKGQLEFLVARTGAVRKEL